MICRCECGRNARSLPRRITRRSSRRARAGVPRALKHHPLCLKCWRREIDRHGAWLMALASAGLGWGVVAG
jgi:hypothetical protein